MKKLFSLLAAFALAFSFSGCVDDAPTKETAVSTASASTADTESEKSQKEIFALNETAVFSDLKFTANELKESSGSDFFEPDSGNVFIGVKFTIENISDEEKSVSPLLLFDAYVDDVKASYSISASCVFNDGSLTGTIGSGKKLVGWYALEVPKAWKCIEIDVNQTWTSNNAAKFNFTK